MRGQGATLQVKGYTEFLAACDNAGKETKKYVRGTFRAVGDIVRVDASRLFATVNARSAVGYRTYVRQRGVEVDQSLRRTPIPWRRRPAYSHLQMERAMLPSLQRNEPKVVDKMADAIDTVCDHFEGGP